MKRKRTYHKGGENVVVQTTIPREDWLRLKALADKAEIKWSAWLRRKIIKEIGNE